MSLEAFNKKIKVSHVVRFVVPALIVVVGLYYVQHPYSGSSNITPPNQNSASTPNLSSASNPILDPAYIVIPAINLKAPIEDVGKTPSGSMAVPTNFTDVGWYKYGALPGTKGNAVIDGHVDNALGLAGVFKNLNLLKVGDIVTIEDHSGKTASFKVVKMEIYPYNQSPIEEIFGKTNTFSLNLITCNGTWLPGAHTDSDRLVVYTELVV